MKVEYPTANTFIQFAAPRSSSLEEFLKPRSVFSCPASRMVSLEEDPRESTEPIMDDDLLILWPATRGPSLNDEDEASKFAFEMKVALQSVCAQLPVSAAVEDPPVLQAPPPRWASIEDEEDLPNFMKALEKEEEEAVVNQVFQWPATRGPSLDEFAGAHMFSNLESFTAPPVVSEANAVPVVPPVVPTEANAVPEMFVQWTPMEAFMNAKVSSMHREHLASDASTAISTDEDQALATPPSGLSDDEDEAPKDQVEDTSATLKISLTDTLGLWSIGSAAHETGTCKPCAFLWKDLKKPGCQNGRECVFCHLCPPGEVKRRKKEKMFMRKVVRNLQYTDQFAMGFEPHLEPHYQNQVAAGYGMW
jgi:hypothetical protein